MDVHAAHSKAVVEDEYLVLHWSTTTPANHPFNHLRTLALPSRSGQKLARYGCPIQRRHDRLMDEMLAVEKNNCTRRPSDNRPKVTNEGGYPTHPRVTPTLAL